MCVYAVFFADDYLERDKLVGSIFEDRWQSTQAVHKVDGLNAEASQGAGWAGTPKQPGVRPHPKRRATEDDWMTLKESIQSAGPKRADPPFFSSGWLGLLCTKT